MNASLKGNRDGLTVRGTRPTLFFVVGVIPEFVVVVGYFLAVHSIVADPPLGWTFPVVFFLIAIVSLFIEASPYTKGGRLVATKEAGVSHGELLRIQMENHAVGLLFVRALLVVVGLIYFATLAISGQLGELNWPRVVFWAAVVSIAAIASAVFWGRLVYRLRARSVILSAGVLMVGRVLVALTVLSVASINVATLGLVLIIMSEPVNHLLHRERGVALAAGG